MEWRVPIRIYGRYQHPPVYHLAMIIVSEYNLLALPIRVSVMLSRSLLVPSILVVSPVHHVPIQVVYARVLLVFLLRYAIQVVVPLLIRVQARLAQMADHVAMEYVYVHQDGVVLIVPSKLPLVELLV